MTDDAFTQIRKMLRGLQAKMASQPVFVSDDAFPVDHALLLESPEYQFVCAAQPFWDQLWSSGMGEWVADAPSYDPVRKFMGVPLYRLRDLPPPMQPFIMLARHSSKAVNRMPFPICNGPHAGQIVEAQWDDYYYGPTPVVRLIEREPFVPSMLSALKSADDEMIVWVYKWSGAKRGYVCDGPE